MTSDYDKWFICSDGTMDAIKCKRERLIDALKDAVGVAKAAQIHPLFRRATFSESCRLEIELMEGKS